MRTETVMVPMVKYFMTCPRCAREYKINYTPTKDEICYDCRAIIQEEKIKEKLVKYRNMFDRLHSDVGGHFYFDGDASENVNGCCIETQFILTGESGANYCFYVYEDDGRCYVELESIEEAKPSES